MDENKKEICENPVSTYKVHRILAHSYFAYLSLFLVGVVLDIFFPIKIFKEKHADPIGFFLLFIGTVLILWAQYSSHKHREHRRDPSNVPAGAFHKGPYKYTRMPTHFGLFAIMFGFGFVINATFIITTTLISFLLTKFIFLNKEEKILSQKYGEKYTQYKKDVKI